MSLAKRLLIGVALAAVLSGAVMVALPLLRKTKPGEVGSKTEQKKNPKVSLEVKFDKMEIKKFTSPEEFSQYMSDSRKSYGGFSGYGISASLSRARSLSATSMDLGMASSELLPTSVGSNLGLSADSKSSGNYSTTNVQVEGVDEPDTIKTDGKYIYSQYIAPYTYDYYSYYPYNQKNGYTQIVGALPANDLKKIAKIQASGEFLIKDNIVMIFENTYPSKKVRAFDITDTNSPKEIWTLNLANYGSVLGARLSNGQLYLATGQSTYNYYDYSPSPCPFEAYSVSGVTTTVACTDIYHPTKPIASSETYTVSQIDPVKGTTLNKVSFVGSYGSIFYMAPGNIYVSYTNGVDDVKFMYGFLSSNKDFVPAETVTKLEKLLSYDISNNAKTVEMQYIMEGWLSSLSKDDKLKFENEFENRLNKYLDEHMRDLSSLSIVKVGLNDFGIKGVGVVPGSALNQFSFDEYQDTLRVAVTVGSGFWGSSGKSVNDVYTLDSSMNTAGSVLDLGKGERIYAVRFVGDRGYVVTFRQTDPFYVLSFSDPKNPKLEGELKIPGFSNYLEPLRDHLILGIGKEGAKVKLSLFDVTDPKNPTEKDKYELNEYWSEALGNHHAFMKNSSKQLFFLPGSMGGYFFSYANDKLSMVKAISETNVKRALYIGDVFYLVSGEKISSWDSSSWNKLGEISISEPGSTSTPAVYMPPVYSDLYRPKTVTTLPVTQTRDARRTSDLKQIQTALELFYTDMNKYPSGNGLILGSSKASCLSSAGFGVTGCKNPYMGAVPSDPTAGQNYTYTASKDGMSYTVTAKLEGNVNTLKAGTVKLTPSGISN